jgi:pSer/pThr/pTyr-binding forkhead associated (FHA) protein
MRVSEPKVGRRQAIIGRVGGIWVVRDLRATNPTRLLDPSGKTQILSGEVRITSRRLLVGDTIVILLPADA